MNDAAPQMTVTPVPDAPEVDPVANYFVTLRDMVQAEMTARNVPGPAFDDDTVRLVNMIIHRIQRTREMPDSVAVDVFDMIYRQRRKDIKLTHQQTGKAYVVRSLAQFEQWLVEEPIGERWQATLERLNKKQPKRDRRRLAWKFYAVEGEPVTCENGHYIGCIQKDIQDQADMNDALLVACYTMVGLDVPENTCWCGAAYARETRGQVLLEGIPNTTRQYNIAHVWR